MRSIFLWLLGFAAGLSVAYAASDAIAQGIPNGITYQGMLLQNGAPYTGIVDLDFTFTDSSGAFQTFTMSRTGVQVINGIFNIVLGPFPQSLDFNEQYSMTIVVTMNGTQTTLPPQLFWSAPYAFNAGRVNGILASPVPVNGELFPVPLDANGRIDSAMLPSPLVVSGGLSAANSTPDGTGLAAASPQNRWADRVPVASGTGTSLQIYNTLVSPTSMIIVMPVGSSAVSGSIILTAQAAGTFTISSASALGTSGGGTVTALNYLIVNH